MSILALPHAVQVYECIWHNSFNQPLFWTFPTTDNATVQMPVEKPLKIPSSGTALKI
jgi:hypothetical protein